MKKTNRIQVLPDVERITEGLRDTGYDLNTALADLIDNAIAAKATFIDVRLGLKENGEPVVAVGDNGTGMDQEALINCMRYGSRPQEDISRLGKFGLGLKTASTAFCRRVVVVSRLKARGKARQAAWDLDHLAACGQWEMELVKPDTLALEYLDLCSQKGPGTVVIWEKIDRLLSAEVEPLDRGNNAAAQNPLERLERITRSLEAHLGMVFQRFLDPGCEQTRTIRLLLNGAPVRPWNPFCPEYSTLAATHILTVTKGEDVVPIVVKAHLLPREETLPDEGARKSVDVTANRQGIYVYRENRLIHGPDWLGIHQSNPAWSLLRISLSFDARMDSAFMVDIKKSRVLINEQLYAWLKDTFLPSLLERAEERWRQGKAEALKQTAETRHAVSDNVIEQNLPNLRKAELLELFPERQEALVRNNTGTALAFLRIIQQEGLTLRHILPTNDMPEDQLWEPAIINGEAAVKLNVAHPFYARVYMPNENNSPLVQGLDMLFWSLAQAEVNNVTTESREYFAAMRAELARNVTKMAQVLPE